MLTIDIYILFVTILVFTRYSAEMSIDSPENHIRTSTGNEHHSEHQNTEPVTELVSNFMSLEAPDQINELNGKIEDLKMVKRKIKLIIKQFITLYNHKLKDKTEQLAALQAIMRDFLDSIKDKGDGMYQNIIGEIGEDWDHDGSTEQQQVLNEILDEHQKAEVKHIYRFLAKIYNTAGFSDEKRNAYDEKVLKEFDEKMRQIKEMEERGELDELRKLAELEENYKPYEAANQKKAEEIKQNEIVRGLLREMEQLSHDIERLQKSELYLEYLKAEAWQEEYWKDERKNMDGEIAQLQATVNSIQTHLHAK